MNFDSFEAILKFAIEREREAIDFYEGLADRKGSAGTRETFLAFAREEKKHETLLQDFLKGDKAVGDYDFRWVPDLKRSDYTVDMAYEEGMGYADLLRLAMKREEASLKLYNELAGKVSQEDLLRLFQMLSQEEAKHKLALESLYDDYMAKQGD